MPSARGPRKSSIVVSDNDGSTPQTIVLTGVGTATSLTPSSLIFPAQTVGTSSTAQTITLANASSAPINTWQIAVRGADATEFSTSSTCPGDLAAGSRCTISVTFAPTASGTRTATLLVSDDGGGSPQAVTLAGTGAAAAAR